MTPAEFKTIRESLGLTEKWIADHSDVNLKTVEYWESGRMAIPKEAEKMFANIDRLLDKSVAKVLTQIEEVEKVRGEPPDEVMLLRYRTDADLWQFYPEMKPLPASTYATLLSRVRRRLWSKGIPSVIEYMEPEDYQAWLGDQPDTEAHRAAWATEKQNNEFDDWEEEADDE